MGNSVDCCTTNFSSFWESETSEAGSTDAQEELKSPVRNRNREVVTEPISPTRNRNREVVTEPISPARDRNKEVVTEAPEHMNTEYVSPSQHDNNRPRKSSVRRSVTGRRRSSVRKRSVFSGTCIRRSKFRNLFGVPPKVEYTFSNLRINESYGDGNGIAANKLYVAASIQGGGGVLMVEPIESYKRFDSVFPTIQAHKAPITDIQFHPFHSHLLASAAEDNVIKLWEIPVNGITESTSNNSPKTILKGHGRKVFTIKFHPTVSEVLLSTSADSSAKLWNIEQNKVIYTINDTLDNNYHDILWSPNGGTFSISSKDQSVRIYDSRTGQNISTILNVHNNNKSIKLCNLDDEFSHFITTGHGSGSLRQVKIWDPRNTKEEVFKMDLDVSSGVVLPQYDPDLNLLYLTSRGSSSININEVDTKKMEIYPLAECKTGTPIRGVAMIPKYALDTSRCEVARIMKLTSTSVDPISIMVPRLSTSMQLDLYPSTKGDTSPHTYEEWYTGSNQIPVLYDMKVLMKQQQQTSPKSYSQLKSSSYMNKNDTTTATATTTTTGTKTDSNISITLINNDTSEIDSSNNIVRKDNSVTAKLFDIVDDESIITNNVTTNGVTDNTSSTVKSFSATLITLNRITDTINLSSQNESEITSSNITITTNKNTNLDANSNITEMVKDTDTTTSTNIIITPRTPRQGLTTSSSGKKLTSSSNYPPLDPKEAERRRSVRNSIRNSIEDYKRIIGDLDLTPRLSMEYTDDDYILEEDYDIYDDYEMYDEEGDGEGGSGDEEEDDEYDDEHDEYYVSDEDRSGHSSDSDSNSVYENEDPPTNTISNTVNRNTIHESEAESEMKKRQESSTSSSNSSQVVTNVTTNMTIFNKTSNEDTIAIDCGKQASNIEYDSHHTVTTTTVVTAAATVSHSENNIELVSPLPTQKQYGAWRDSIVTIQDDQSSGQGTSRSEGWNSVNEFTSKKFDSVNATNGNTGSTSEASNHTIGTHITVFPTISPRLVECTTSNTSTTPTVPDSARESMFFGIPPSRMNYEDPYTYDDVTSPSTKVVGAPIHMLDQNTTFHHENKLDPTITDMNEILQSVISPNDINSNTDTNNSQKLQINTATATTNTSSSGGSFNAMNTEMNHTHTNTSPMDCNLSPMKSSSVDNNLSPVNSPSEASLSPTKRKNRISQFFGFSKDTKADHHHDSSSDSTHNDTNLIIETSSSDRPITTTTSNAATSTTTATTAKSEKVVFKSRVREFMDRVRPSSLPRNFSPVKRSQPSTTTTTTTATTSSTPDKS